MLMLAAMPACGAPIEAPTEPPVTTAPPTTRPPTTVPPTTAPTEPPDDFVADGNVNPLTGLCDGIPDTALGTRPAAIMVSNSKDSLPQWGISQADIIWEMLAEGRITRFLAIFQDPTKIDKLASIRSARPYYIDIAQSYGAVYMHFGGSEPAFAAIKARSDLVSINGLSWWEGVLFHRDPDRRKALGMEHSVYTAGEYMADAYERLDKPMELESTPSAFKFSTTHSALEGEPADKVTLTFSSGHKPWFEYDAEAGVYRRWQYGDPHMDAYLDKQIECKNLLVLRMVLTDVPGSALKLVEIDTTGEGDGLYFCEGKYVPITWKKDAYNTPITFYTEDGAELVCARGQSFISVMTTTADLEIEVLNAAD